MLDTPAMARPPLSSSSPSFIESHIFHHGAHESLADWSASVAAMKELPGGMRRDVARAIDLARRFNHEVVMPQALALDARIEDDPQHLPWDFIAEANRWGLFTMWLPKMFGGHGWNMLSMYAFVEEVSTQCVGLANVVGVHYLGVATLMATWNLRLARQIFKEVCEGERQGKPCLLSLAITEPGAGTDVEETELVDRARLGTVATPQAGGAYELNGRKVFISNGHVSTWHMVIAYEDRRRPADTMVALAVRTGAPGFSFGAQEHKLGQKACVASELVFDRCQVPVQQVALAPRHTARLGRAHREVAQTMIDYVVSSTRAGVGAFATGVARGVFEATRDRVAGMRCQQGRLIEQQWVQTTLADMGRHAVMSRLAYMESAMANCLGGLFALLFTPPLYQLERWLPRGLMRVCSAPLLNSPAFNDWAQRRLLAHYPVAWQNLTSGLGSMAKVACSDLAMQNCGLALSLLGIDGLAHDSGIEKRLRDAKLLQIYEGTNQLNRINHFKCLLRPDEGVHVFVREDAP
ncbi:acyl-CoA dehydrogenase family protein [Aquabacterium sp.]|uniref:acyl-CoA dehydrogenase family protein n=1 Tax=Aquabacterium sp. TaxID=1872578 RepID=UPI0040384B31